MTKWTYVQTYNSLGGKVKFYGAWNAGTYIFKYENSDSKGKLNLQHYTSTDEWTIKRIPSQEDWDVVLYGDPKNNYTPSHCVVLSVPTGASVEIELRWANVGSYGVGYDSRNHGNPAVYLQNGPGTPLHYHEIVGPFKQYGGGNSSIVIGGNYRATGGAPRIVYLKARIIPAATNS